MEVGWGGCWWSQCFFTAYGYGKGFQMGVKRSGDLERGHDVRNPLDLGVSQAAANHSDISDRWTMRYSDMSWGKCWCSQFFLTAYG